MKPFSPKPFLPLLFICLFTFGSQAQNAWFNEFHYDNDGGDVGEFVEIVIENPSSFELDLFTVSLYNGSDGEPYGGSYTLDTFIEGVSENGFTVFSKDISGIQNGSPDGFSLDYDGALIQFISYEGEISGTAGPAGGETSEDVGVEEAASTASGESLQLSGTGTVYSDFTWEEPAGVTKGGLNNGQDLGLPCAAPTIQANFADPVSEEIENNQISLNWSRGDGDGVVILARESAAVDEMPKNGMTYSADSDFTGEFADEIGSGNFVVYNGSASSLNVTGLTQGTEYHFAIFEYFTAGQCYLTESETISTTTTNSFDQNSEIKAPLNQIPSTDISSIANSEGDAIEVFRFDIKDKGSSDGLPTVLNTVIIEKSMNNSVEDWSAAIKGAKLNDGSSDLTMSTISISQDKIEFDLTGNEFTITDGGTETLRLLIWLNETQVDGDIFGFEIPENHGLVADPSGSSFISAVPNPITSNDFKIDVEASQLLVTSTVQEYFIEDIFSITVSAVDSNGNTDQSARTVNISSDGKEALQGDLQSDLVDGNIEFENLRYPISEEIMVTVDDGTLTEQLLINFIKPEIMIDTTGFSSDFGVVSFPIQSDYHSYELKANNLKDTLFIKAPNGFQIALNPEFSSPNDTIIILKDSSFQEEVFVRFSPDQGNGRLFQASISHISQDADTVILELSGQEGTLRLSSIASVKNKPPGERVKIQGVVIGGNNQFAAKRIIQDETAGILLDRLNSPKLNFGDSVEVEGVLVEEGESLSLVPDKEINIFSSDSIIVESILKQLNEINYSVEFQRVRIENLEFLNDGYFSAGEYTMIDDSSDSLAFILNSDYHPLIGTAIPYGKVNVTGFISRANDDFQINPEFVHDLEIIPRDTVLSIDAPAEGLIFGSVMVDELSEVQSYSLQADNISDDLQISVSGDFEISLLEDSNYASELMLPVNERGDIPQLSVFVRFSPRSARGGEVRSEIEHFSGNQQYVIPLLGIEEIISSNESTLDRKILIYPNPVGSELKIKLLEPDNYSYQLLGIDGAKIRSGKIMKSKNLLLDEVEPGIYLFKISNGCSDYHQRIIKK